MVLHPTQELSKGYLICYYARQQEITLILLMSAYIYKYYIMQAKPASTSTPNYQHFEQQTNTFSLLVSLDEKVLTVELHDYIDWCIYQKEFIRGDNCADIHKKLDLIDVFTSFYQTQTRDDEEAQEEPMTSIKKYVFGTIIKKSGVPCYSISRGGIITSYTYYTEKLSKKQFPCESKLKLIKTRDMTDREVFNSKINIERSETNDKLEEMAKKIEKQNEKIQELQSIAALMSLTKHKITLDQSYSSYFSFSFPNLRYSSSTGNWTSYFFNYPITSKSVCKFKITNTQSQYMMIGVADYFKEHKLQYSHSSGNAMCYYAVNGYKYPTGVAQGTGFKTGDIVQIHVDRTTKTIKYSVNGTLQATDTHNMLEDKSRTFVPFVEFCTVNDAVEWIVD